MNREQRQSNLLVRAALFVKAMWHFITLFAVAHSVIISASGEIDFPYHSLIQFGLRGHSQEAESMMVATTSTAKEATVVVVLG